MGLGPLSATSLAEARQKARDAHTHINKGLRTTCRAAEAEAHRRKHEGVFFSDIAKRYIDTHHHSWTNAKHTHAWASSLELDAYPIRDQKPLSELTKEDVLEVLDSIWRDKRETAKKIHSRIKLILVYSRKAHLYFG